MRNNSTWARSPLSPTIWPRNAWSPWPTIFVFVGAVALFIVVQISYIVAAVMLHAIDPRAVTQIPVSQNLMLQFVSWGATGIYLVLVIPRALGAPLETLGFRAPTPRDLGVAASGALVMVVLVNGAGTLAAALSHRHDTEAAMALMHQLRTPEQRAAFTLLACGVAPFCEELVFRGFIFNALTRFVPLSAAMVLSGAIFGVLHATDGWPGELLTVGVPLTLGGILLAYVYARTKCFWANVTTHALFNAVSVVSVLFFHVSQ